MTRDVISVEEDDNLIRLLETLGILRFRHLPVTDDDHLIGLLTERDLLAVSTSNLLPHHRRSDRLLHEHIRVRDIMVRNVLTASPEMPVRAAGELLLRQRFGCLPVVTAENALVGIVTSSDFIKLVVKATREG